MSSKEKSAQDPKSLRVVNGLRFLPPCRWGVTCSLRKRGLILRTGGGGLQLRGAGFCEEADAAADLHFWCMLGLPGMERGLKRLVEKIRPVIETSPTGVSGGLGKGEAANGKGNDLALPFIVMLGRREPREPHFLLMRLLSMPKKEPYSHTD